MQGNSPGQRGLAMVPRESERPTRPASGGTKLRVCKPNVMCRVSGTDGADIRLQIGFGIFPKTFRPRCAGRGGEKSFAAGID